MIRHRESIEPKMTTRLRAEEVGVMMASDGMRRLFELFVLLNLLVWDLRLVVLVLLKLLLVDLRLFEILLLVFDLD